jgi:hypothetical protein
MRLALAAIGELRTYSAAAVGIEIIRWRGPHYVPGKRETGRAPGTNGTSVLPALDGAALARHQALAASLEAGGWSPGVCRLAATT